MSDIPKASHLPALAKAEQDERNRTDEVQRECDERLEAVRLECRAEIDDVPRSLRERRRAIVEDATAKADCDLDTVVAATEKELAIVRDLADSLTEDLVTAAMKEILPNSPECQRHGGGPS